MNRRQAEAKRHAGELANAKRELMFKANQQIQQARSQGYTTEIAPQLLHLLGVKSYRKRELQTMNVLISDPDKLSEYIAVVNPQTGELQSGGQALERYSRYQSSAIYRASSSSIPSEKDIIFDNFSQTVEQAFTDNGVYEHFMQILDAVYYNADMHVADDAFWEMIHPSIAKTKTGKAKSQSSINSSQRYWMQENRERINDIHNAVLRLAQMEGDEAVAKRLADAGETIIDEIIVAAIGYNDSSSKAAQTILNVLLPSGVRNRAMSMGESLMDEADDFGDFDE